MNTPVTTPNAIKERLAQVRAEIADLAAAHGRRSDQVQLIAVSKTHPADRIEQALAAGQRLFGENRIQEAAEKWPALKELYPDAELHLIGPLQTNKVKYLDGLVDVIHSVDREKLARALAKSFGETGRALPCFVQINTGEEDQKAGVSPKDADAFIRLCRDDLGLPVRGLMCIPPIDEDPGLHFALLREIAARNGLQSLSMGMSGDYAEAIRFGASFVRIGTAIFGDRQPPAAAD